MRKTIIESATGNVVNVVELDDDAQWAPPSGQTIGTDGGEMGQKWNGSGYEWIDPPAIDPPIVF
jgi:hypothetical protein